MQLHSLWSEELVSLSSCSPLARNSLLRPPPGGRLTPIVKTPSKKILGFTYPLDLKGLENRLRKHSLSLPVTTVLARHLQARNNTC